jgi:hypothetical protein
MFKIVGINSCWEPNGIIGLTENIINNASVHNVDISDIMSNPETLRGACRILRSSIDRNAIASKLDVTAKITICGPKKGILNK